MASHHLNLCEGSESETIEIAKPAGAPASQISKAAQEDGSWSLSAMD